MKYVNEFRRPEINRLLIEQIEQTVTRPWVIMEICGGHTHAIMKYGIDQVLPQGIELIHGPGCPVCVTPAETIDKAVAIALHDGVIFTSFGDMLRVPGNHSSLSQARSQGADIRIVYSPLEALDLARKHPEREVVFFGIGFETTVPANAMTVMQAHREELTNFSMLVSQFRVPPVLQTLLSSPQNRVHGYLGAGHVSTVTGLDEYEPIADTFGVPIVATGFEPMDILEGILMVARQLENGTHQVQNQYRRAVTQTGNSLARQITAQVFEPTDRPWRGIGNIRSGGLSLRKTFEDFDADQKFHHRPPPSSKPDVCISGQILKGLARPDECAAFGRECTPATPLGAPMVSGEGACAAYYRYRLFVSTARDF
jgi:hydrogenase expression/formation protein HypD